jgi:NitT/TauT family transport system substrate-binding protein
MKRSHFVALSAATVAAQARPARAAGNTIRLGSSPVEEWAIPYYAAQKGFFRDAGLDVEVSNFPGGGFVTQAVLGGALDVGLTNSGSMAAAHVRGLPLYLLASGPIYTVKAPIAHLIVAKNSPINDAAGLGGKTVGVTTLNDMVQAAAM